MVSNWIDIIRVIINIAGRTWRDGIRASIKTKRIEYELDQIWLINVHVPGMQMYVIAHQFDE